MAKVEYGTLVSNNENICYNGDPSIISFETLPTGGSGNYTYQWYYKDGIFNCPTGSSTTGWTIVNGGNSFSYDPPTNLTTSRTYACLVTATAGGGCVPSAGWALQCRQVTVNANLNYGSLGYVTDSICSGGVPDLISFITLPSGGSGSYTYQWYYQNGLVGWPDYYDNTNGWTAIPGATSSTYLPGPLTATRTYACYVTGYAGLGCPQTFQWAAGSRQIRLASNPLYGYVNYLLDTICPGGDPVNITLGQLPSGGSNIFAYQWYYKEGNSSCGGNISNWTIINGATSTSYNPPAGLYTSRTYGCYVTILAGGGCPQTSAFSTQCRWVIIRPGSTFGTMVSGNETICTGGDPAGISFTTLPAAGSTFQWYYQDGLGSCPSGTSTTGWTLISGATSNTYDPPSGLQTSRTYSCYVTTPNGACLGSSGWAAQCRQVSIAQPVAYGTLTSADASLCTPADPLPITFATVPSGGSGSFTYQWYYQDGLVSCPAGSSTAGWTLISGATAVSYDPPTGLTTSRTYACLVTNSSGGGCSATTNWAAQCRKITVGSTPIVLGTLVDANESFCGPGNPSTINFAIPPSGGSGSFTYQWYYRVNVVPCPAGISTINWTVINGATASSYTPPAGLSASRAYACYVTATSSPGCAATSGWATQCRQITITNPVTFGTLNAVAQSFCTTGDPSAISFSSPTFGGPGTYTYEWYYQDGIVSAPSGNSTTGWTLISGANANTYDPPAGLTNSRTYACMIYAAAMLLMVGQLDVSR
ncbi:MAG: hypothetical protein M0D57_08695 [Sphingobacteriales bacterium JAD_PAG50586_3]|nr:MAG: hypothetical protein M0D57_08695 [Sphingobacteriales bacterium JAD_PAG50586_3]